MARFMSGDAVQGIRTDIKGTVTEVHIGADSIFYTLVSDDRQLLYAYECELVLCLHCIGRSTSRRRASSKP